MAREFRQFDAHGFPIPPRFEEIKYQDDRPKRKPKISLSVKRWVVVALLLGLVVPIVLGPRIIKAGRGAIAAYCVSRAEKKLQTGDLPGALAELDSAIEWQPEDWQLYEARAQLRYELNHLDGALADCTQLLDLLVTQDRIRDERGLRINRAAQQAQVYTLRSTILMRLGRGREAIDDANQALLLHPAPAARATLLNSRAYARAQANLELAEGLVDVEEALKLEGEDVAAFLDTRAYLLHLLGQNEKALVDMDSAIEQTQEDKLGWMRMRGFRAGPQVVERRLKDFDLNLAVMHQHRSLVYAALGRQKEAAAEHELAVELGYDETRGEK